MNPEPKVQVENIRSHLDEKVTITGGTVNRVAAPVKNRGFARRCRYLPKTYRIARPQLSEFPQLIFYNDNRAHKTTETGPIGPEQDRHISGKIHRADCIGIVVNVRGMQSGFAAVLARPLRPRP